MTRLDGEKKSPTPWIIGLIVLALLAAAVYYFVAVKGTDTAVVNQNGVELLNAVPGDLTDTNATDTNATDTNTADANATDANATDANATDANSTDVNAVDANAIGGAMMSNSATGDSNSAMMDSNNAMSNSATGDSNSAMMDNSASGAAPSLTPASSSASDSSGNNVVATRSKTIETNKAKVTYSKSVLADGSATHSKTVVPKPATKVQ